ncbi:hypothetical protein Lqui_0601 [Legionella quinlivanii]|uniref:Uncharacterized protein n=1 Tax=Legionella quinlivanii TaxID=45073 RepID=A0A0W0Y420_9GAMM|nr:hypothetical protein [Legionella quinlivanii]KTD51757.1 hypothetical protein Lqui_0601 [Legionella quinlivanii]SEF65386.1 hypothetical protein SAMN02746093_00741 [Legionella quinlivanii DSM 21216]STY10715.1 Uncharacterised protein [Legionella quinlivanii]
MPFTSEPIDTLDIYIKKDLSDKMGKFFAVLRKNFTEDDANTLLTNANAQVKPGEMVNDRIAIILINQFIKAEKGISYEPKESVKKGEVKDTYFNDKGEKYYQVKRLVSQRWRVVYFKSMLEKCKPPLLPESESSSHALSTLNEAESAPTSTWSILQGFKNSLGEEYSKLFAPKPAEKRKLEKEVDELKRENKKIRSSLRQVMENLNNLKAQHESLLRVLSPLASISTSSSCTLSNMSSSSTSSSSTSSEDMLTLNRNLLFSNSASAAIEPPGLRQKPASSGDCLIPSSH